MKLKVSLINNNKIYFRNKIPEYNKSKYKYNNIVHNCYVLKYKNRKIIPNKKNFQLESVNIIDNKVNEDIYLQFGETIGEHYILDFKHPFSYFEAFTLAVSCIKKKYLC